MRHTPETRAVLRPLHRVDRYLPIADHVPSQAGAPTNRNGAWALGTANLTPYAGHSVRILIEAADATEPAWSKPASTTHDHPAVAWRSRIQR